MATTNVPGKALPGVGFVLPLKTLTNTKNLANPGQLTYIDTAADPWGFLGNPYGTPARAQRAQWNKLVCQRYGQPKEGDILPYPGTAVHSTSPEEDLETIATEDPGWFKTVGYGPGPAGRNGKPTQLEVHDVQYAKGVREKVARHAKELRTPEGP